MLHTYGKYFPQHLQLPKNTDTMISPARRLPAASILQVSAIAVRRDRYRSPQYGDAFFLHEMNCFFLFY